MTTIAERLAADLRTAMKARDRDRVSTLRMVLAAVREEEVAGDSARTLSDAETEAVLRREAKKRAEAAAAFRAGGRDESAAAEEAELAIIESYLPAGLTDDELASLVDRVLAGGGFDDPSQMGQAMKAVMVEVAGRADGKQVSALVKDRLAR